jgi:nitric oxide synthase oxygenase domain/subunit
VPPPATEVPRAGVHRIQDDASEVRPVRPAYRWCVEQVVADPRLPIGRLPYPRAPRHRSRSGTSAETRSRDLPDPGRDHLLPLLAGGVGLGSSRYNKRNRGLVGLNRAVRWSAPVSGVGVVEAVPFTRFV